MMLSMFKYWFLGIAGMAISMRFSKERTLRSFMKSRQMMGSMIFDILGILMIIGVLMAVVPMETVTKALGESDHLALAVAGSSLAGGITIIPAFIAFPLIGALREQGAHVMVVTAFLTTLTMVGVATLKLEIGEFGRRFALMRNALSFILALLIAIVMGVIL